MHPYINEIIIFLGEREGTEGYRDLYTTFGECWHTRIISIRYLILDANTSYKILLRCPSINSLGAIISTPHLTMKFPSWTRDIITSYVNKKTTRECYISSLQLPTPQVHHFSNNVEKVVQSC